MTWNGEMESWKWGNLKGTPAPVPEIGSQAPTFKNMALPNPNGKPTIIAFLRHCGCPFAEKTFHEMRNLANKHKDVNFVAVSHSDEPSTEKWVVAVGGDWDVEVVVDSERELYLAWGLGVSNFWHVLNPWSILSVLQLSRRKGAEHFVNRPTESGTRWQTSGSFAVDKDGVVRWVRVAPFANDIPDFKEALKSVGIEA